MLIFPPIPGIQLFQNLTLEGHGWSQSWKSQHGPHIQSTHIPFNPCQSGIPFLSYYFFKIWPWKSKVKVMGEVTVQSLMTMMLRSFRSREFHRTLNGINPSSSIRDMGSAKSGPSAAWFDMFLAHGQAHRGQITMMLHNYKSRQVHKTLNGVNQSRDMRSAVSWPNLRQIWHVFGPWASPYGAKDHDSAKLQA